MRNSWALASATRVLFEKNKIVLSELSKVWDKNTIYICERDGALANGKPRLIFLSSCGPLANVKVGTRKQGHNNATFASLGYLRVLNVVEVRNGVVVSSENDEYLDVKAPLMVFK